MIECLDVNVEAANNLLREAEELECVTENVELVQLDGSEALWILS